MVTIEKILRQIPDPRGRQGRLHPLHALLGLMILSLLSGRKGMKAAFRMGRNLSQEQLESLGFCPGSVSPCHATLTQLLRNLDPDAMVRVFSQLTAKPDGYVTKENQIAIDGKTMRGSKDVDGKTLHVLSAFCAETEQMTGHTSSRGKGMEIPDALKLIKNTDLNGMHFTGDAIFCHRKITEEIVEKGGDYFFRSKGIRRICAMKLLQHSMTRFFRSRNQLHHLKPIMGELNSGKLPFCQLWPLANTCVTGSQPSSPLRRLIEREST